MENNLETIGFILIGIILALTIYGEIKTIRLIKKGEIFDYIEESALSARVFADEKTMEFFKKFAEFERVKLLSLIEELSEGATFEEFKENLSGLIDLLYKNQEGAKAYKEMVDEFEENMKNGSKQ